MHARSSTLGHRERRSGYALWLMLVSFLFVVAMIVALQRMARPAHQGGALPTLTLYCAAGIMPPVQDVITAFRAETGVEVQVQYGGSGTLLAQFEVHPEGVDLYLAADDSYCTTARGKGLVSEILPLCEMRPVLAVAKGNPLQIQTTADLLRIPGLRFGFANPDAAAVGRVTRQLLQSSGHWEALEAASTVMKPTVTDLANDLRVGALDAGVVWDATVAQYPDLDAVELLPLAAGKRLVAIGVATATEHSVEALRFARYLQARDRGADSFRAHGYRPVAGDRWTATPKLVLYAGSMFRNAIDRTVHAFCQREGVEVTRVYDGCGILVSQMKAGGRPDAYFSCDDAFLDQVAERFTAPVHLSDNPMVIVTAAGNPHQLHSLGDLARPGLRVGLAHPDKSALGHLTRKLLQDIGLYNTILDQAEVKQDLPQGDLLVASLAAGALDAAVVYSSNATLQQDRLRLVPIELEGALAHQPYAVARDTDFAWTMGRLLDAVTAAPTRARFVELGFDWKYEPSDPRD